MTLEIDLELLRQFEDQLDPQHPEAGAIPATVLGYGEISTVFAIGDAAQREVAYKRMPIFQSQDELEAYQRAFDAYQRLLTEKVGLSLPEQSTVSLVSRSGRIVYYIAQRRLGSENIGSRLVHRLTTPDVLTLMHRLLGELARVWRYNSSQPSIQIGLDGQVSNWAVTGWDPQRLGLAGQVQLHYLDTSTPLVRIDGREQLNPELFLRGAPSFLAWLLKRLFMQDVVDRYYDLRRVVVDLIANFYKEQLPGLVPDLVKQANEFFSSEARDLDVEPITLGEVASYYREDALIWRLYQGSRRTDQFLHTRILHREYPYILPVITRR